MKNNSIIGSKINEVAAKYAQEGYKVTIQPRGSNIPEFAKEFDVDIVANKDDDNVIVAEAKPFPSRAVGHHGHTTDQFAVGIA